MKTTPRIFVSSTLRGLKRHRRALHDLIQDQLHMSPWCFEINGTSEVSASLSVLAKRIAEADLVVCIIGVDYGSELGHEPISFTEWELQTAIYYRKEIKLYIEESSAARDARLASLLAILSDELVGHFAARFSSISDLCRKVTRDLSSWRTSNWSHCRRLTRDLGNATMLPLLLRTPSADRRARFSGRRLKDALGLENALHDVRVLKTTGNYGTAYDKASAIFHRVTDKGRLGDKANTDLRCLAEFLSLFANILAIRNQIRCGDISAVVVAKAEFKIRQFLNDKAGMLASASAISAILNMAGLGNQALSWNTFALERSQYIISPSSILDSRSSILRSQRKFAEAEQALLNAIAVYDGTNDDFGYMFSRLAGIQFSLGKERDPQKNLDRAFDLVRDEGLGRVIFVRESLPILIATHEMNEAQKQLHTGLATEIISGGGIKERACYRLAVTH